MKKSLSFFSAMKVFSALVALSLTGCASTKTVSVSSNQNKSDCQFEFGADVSAYFTGTAEASTEHSPTSQSTQTPKNQA